MKFGVLGPIEVTAGDVVLPLGGPKARVLLAVLLARRGQVVSADLLADVLWGDELPPTALPTLQTHVSKLRRLLDGAGAEAELVRRPPGYVLQVDDELVDAARFERQVDAGRRLLVADPEGSALAFEAALEEWRGPAFAEFSDCDWARPEAVRLEELRLNAVEDRLESRLASGHHLDVVSELEALVGEHPLRERFRGQLMLALYRSGRQAEALRSAQDLRRSLGEELGLEPSPALRQLESDILTDAPTLAWVPPPTAAATAPSSPAAPSPPWRPDDPAPLIGRDEELERLGSILFSTRLITLTGVGGVGTTRLATRLARNADGRFEEGAHLVELAAVTQPSDVMVAVGAALDVEQRPGRSREDSIVEVLSDRELLLVMDNCEHVLDGVSGLLGRIVRWCPEVRVLCTSREPIGLPGEVVWPVVPLPVPGSAAGSPEEVAAAPAVEIFVTRAREASPDFVLSNRNVEAAAEVCIRLDGVPLALELAAARMGSMSPDLLARHLDDGFGLLRRPRAPEPRHRSLVDVVEWSYRLLTPDEQLLLDCLAVFNGGFDLLVAEQILAGCGIDAGRTASLVSALVDKSLLVVDDLDGHTRYRQLQTVRQFALERLERRPQGAEVRRSHTRRFGDLAADGESGLEGRDEARWSRDLGLNVDNLRSAFLAAEAEGDVDAAIGLVVSAREFAFRRIRYELVGWARSATQLPGSDAHARYPTALAVVGYGLFVRGELTDAIAIGRQAVRAADRSPEPSGGLQERVLANALTYQGEIDEALTWMDRMVDAARALDHRSRLAHALYMRSVAQTSIGDPLGGRSLADEARAVAEAAGNPTARSQAAYAAGLALASSDPYLALTQLDRAVALAASVGNRWMRAFAMTEGMWLRAKVGEHRLALRGYREVVQTWYRGGDWANQWLSLRHLAAILAQLGRDQDVAMLFGAVEAAGAAEALPFAPTDAEQVRETLGEIEVRLGGDAFAAAVSRGRAMRDADAVRLALESIDALV